MYTSVTKLIWMFSLYLCNTTVDTHQHGADLADVHLCYRTISGCSYCLSDTEADWPVQQSGLTQMNQNGAV